MKISRFIAAISVAAVSGACMLGNLFGASAYSVGESEAIQGEGQTVSVQSIDKDPNGDGVLDILDAVCIARYLAGYICPANVSNLDYDGNGIVSQVDALKVSKDILASHS